MSAEPPPGTYGDFVLDVHVTAADPDFELVFDLDTTPNVDVAAWNRGDFSVRLLSSSSVVVFVRDTNGRVWGPYSFEYRLEPRDPDGACRIITPNRTYYRGDEVIDLSVAYSLPTALASLHLRIGERGVAGYESSEEPWGVVLLGVGPLEHDGVYEITCRVSAPGLPDVDGTSPIHVQVDSTPPEARWTDAPPWVPPSHYEISASDTGSGLLRAEICDTPLTRCIGMREAARGLYQFATAFIAGASDAFQVRARVYDAVGNATVLPLQSISAIALPTGAQPFRHPITLVTAAEFNLMEFLAENYDLAPIEVRDLDFAPLNPEALPLSEGWNEFLFRKPNQPTWDTFAVYRTGVTIWLPDRAPTADHDWLIYASNSTLEVLQAERIARHPVTATTWERKWFDVPRLFFVEDIDGNDQWDDGDPVFLPATDATGEPWLGRGRPVQMPLIPVTATTATIQQTAVVQCADCDAEGVLRVVRRGNRWGAYLGRFTFTGADLSIEPVTTQTFAVAEGDHCEFFWDTDHNGLPSGDERRASAPCDGPMFVLAAGEPLAATLDGGLVEIEGIPYGGLVTGYAESRDSQGGRLFRTPLGRLRDRDGTGMTGVAMPPWPSQLFIYGSGDSAQFSLPGMPSSVTTVTQVYVVDEFGRSVSAAVEAHTPGLDDFRLFDVALTDSVPIARTPGFLPRVRALRDGYLSVWTYTFEDPASVTLLSPAATALVMGYVRDPQGAPIGDALVEWNADPYSSRTVTDELGRYSLPALGAGELSARLPDSHVTSTRELSVQTGMIVGASFTLTAEPRWPLGLLADLYPTALTGPSAANLYRDDMYTWAPLDPGTWALEGPANLSHEFIVPGALPALRFATPQWHPVAWPQALVESTAYLRCGTRNQQVTYGLSPMIDSPCWEWYARWGSREYYLGRPDPDGGMPSAGVNFWSAVTLRNGIRAGGVSLVLRDLVFGRAIGMVSDAQGNLRIALPHGHYRVESPTGGAINDPAGNQAYVVVDHRGATTPVLAVP